MGLRRSVPHFRVSQRIRLILGQKIAPEALSANPSPVSKATRLKPYYFKKCVAPSILRWPEANNEPAAAQLGARAARSRY